MTLVHHEPFALINQLQRDINRVLNHRSGDANRNGLLVSDWTPAVDIKEEANQFVIKADLPGVDAKDIDITMENGVLTLKGQRASETKEETDQYRRYERVRGTFLRRFSLPEVADADHITAHSKDGVLEVTVPKQEAAQPRRIAVQS